MDEALQTEWQAAGMKVSLQVSPDLTARIQTFLQDDWRDHDVYAPCLTTVCPTSETAPEVWWQNAGYKL